MIAASSSPRSEDNPFLQGRDRHVTAYEPARVIASSVSGIIGYLTSDSKGRDAPVNRGLQ